MRKAPFISLDGIDGTGKSTQCRLLVEWLQAMKIPAISCADPGGTALGDRLRAILLDSRDEITLRAEALLFMTSRAELVTRIILPALEAGTVVLSDRYLLANVVYQGHAGGLDPQSLWQLGQFSTGGCLPDLTVVLDLPLDLAAERRGARKDRMESRGEEYYQKVRDGFLKEVASHPLSMTKLSANGPIEDIQTALRQFIVPVLGKYSITLPQDATV